MRAIVLEQRAYPAIAGDFDQSTAQPRGRLHRHDCHRRAVMAAAARSRATTVAPGASSCPLSLSEDAPPVGRDRLDRRSIDNGDRLLPRGVGVA